MIEIIYQPSQDQYKKLKQRPQLERSDMEIVIQKVYDGIAEGGDYELKALTKKFDGVDIPNIKVSDAEVMSAYKSLDADLKIAIEGAKANIMKFHEAQLSKGVEIETMPGVKCIQKSVAIERIGIYIPGGTAPLFSTILMLALPAQIAGCKEVVLCSPPTHEGKIHPVILATAHICGITEIMQVGGSQAIAAMAIGTASIKKVAKIFGPGNQYVTAAKEKAISYGVAIDMPAGPSEVLVYADETCNPSFVAIDLLSQAEHGIDSQVVCVTTTDVLADQIANEIEELVADLPRKDIIVQALKNSCIIIESEVDKAFKFINDYAPEHLIIASESASDLASKIVNAGSVFLGNFCPESVGDYASGTNHTLPTYGWAKSYSGVNVDSFTRKITFQSATPEGLVSLGKLVIPMAEAEHLQAHANAVKIRLAFLSQQKV